MKIWVIKNIKFGYRYTTNSYTRKIILNYFNEYLYNLISSKAKKDDLFIIAGGVFSNTNPSIISIDDANNCLMKLSKVINVILIPNNNDIRMFDGELYSTLKIFNNINVEIFEDGKPISYNNCIIDSNNGLITINEEIISIPNAIAFEKEDGIPSIFVIADNGKHMLLKNNFSPKHITYEINKFSDFDKIENDNNFIHLIINNDLAEENKTLLNMNIFKINPISVKYNNESKKEILNNVATEGNFNIVDKITDAIKDDAKLIEQFKRIRIIYNNNTKLT